ncbi:hypothetical protein BT67DRAFT_392026 [Trichocladium antarcticum]|uniref:DUF7728 domain-containing protein n=1 Tax=Trichocladium antarcticum TaxID=1450529 RepID=A0AAN6UBU5_9PEZI|nr:hypothetical protein BT67DRAFT_392026 [Trichocladium antarcticum]
MLLKPLTVAAGLLAAPAAHAFLIPPEVSDADIHIANTLEAAGPHLVETRNVNIECPGCPILVRGPQGKGIQLQIDRPTHLELTFDIDHQSDFDRLVVNGFGLYPSSDSRHASLLAPQTIDQDHDDDDHKEDPHHLIPQPQRLGFGLHASAGKKDADGGLELVELELQVIEVGVAFIDGIPNVKVQLVKDTSGRLTIVRIEKGESKKVLGASPQECTTAMCKMIAAAREKLKGMRPFKNCHGGGMKGGVAPPAPAPGEAPPHHPHHHHGHHNGHHNGHDGGQWRAPYRKHSWGQLFKNIASHIILPVLIGIVAGVAVSLIGMVVGSMIVSVYRVFSRRGRRHHRHHHRHHSGHAHHKTSRKEAAAVSEEKSGLIEHQDPPPSYEEETAKADQDQV